MYWKDILKRQYEKIHKVRQRLNKLQPKHKLGLAGERVLFTDWYLEDDIVSIKEPEIQCPLPLPVSGYRSSWFNHSNANSACVSSRRHQTHDEYACVLGMTLVQLSPWNQMFFASMCMHGCVCECESITYAGDVQQYLGFVREENCFRSHEAIKQLSSVQINRIERSIRISNTSCWGLHVWIWAQERQEEATEWASKETFAASYSSRGDVSFRVMPSATGFQYRSYSKIPVCCKSLHTCLLVTCIPGILKNPAP